MSDLQSTIERLRLHFGDRLSTTDAVREHHGHDMSRQPTRLPDAVVYVENEAEVARVVSACFDAGTRREIGIGTVGQQQTEGKIVCGAVGGAESGVERRYAVSGEAWLGLAPSLRRYLQRRQ